VGAFVLIATTQRLLRHGRLSDFVLKPRPICQKMDDDSPLSFRLRFASTRL
jgi:hypothetical protein